MYDKLTAGGIPYEEMGGSPTFRLSQNEASASAVYLMSWSNIIAFWNEVFHYDYAVLSGTPPFPMQMPDYPGLYADNIDTVPFIDDKPGGTSAPTNSTIAKVTVNFKTLPPLETDGSSQFTQTITVGGEFLAMPAENADRAIAWWPDGSGVRTSDGDITVGKVIPTVERNMNWSRVPTVPWTAIRNCIGKLNNAVFLGAPIETVLFIGATITGTRNVGTAAATLYSLDYKFSEKPTNWNKFFRPTTGLFEYIKFGVDPGTEYVYNKANLSTLFYPA